MKSITIDTFDGGMAEDIREKRTDTFSYASNFDTYSNSNRLSPYRTMETESIDSGVLTDFKITDVCIMKDSVNTNIYGLGRAGSADNNPKFFQKATVMSITADFQAATGGEDTTANVIPGTLREYKQRLFCMSEDGTSTYVRAYNHATGAIAAIGTISAYPAVSSSIAFPRPFRHPQDDILYCGAGNVVAKYDNSSFTAAALTLPTDCYITSFADYGAYLGIFTAPTIGGGSSKLYLWDVGRALTTVQEVIDLGEGSVLVGDNINGILVSIMSNKTPTTNSVFNLKTKILVKAYYGGTVEVLKELTSSSDTFTLPAFKSKNSNRLFFACKGTFNGNAINQLWCVSKNGNKWAVTPDRLINNDTALTGEINGFSLIGDYLWANFNTASLFRTRLTSATYPTSIYETLINHGQPEEDRTKRKKLMSVSVSKASTTGQLVIKYSVDGSSYVTIGTLSASSGIVLKATNESDGKPFLEGYEYQFKVESTTGAELTEVKYSYEVINTELI